MNNFVSNTEDFSFNNTQEIPFEEDYELIKNNPYVVYQKYYYKLRKVVSNIAFYKSYNMEDLMQQCYINFVELCELYDPYYQGNFVKFDRYVFSNVMMRLKAYIQKYYKNINREKPSEIQDFNLDGHNHDMHNAEDKYMVQYVYKYLGKKQQLILKYYYMGYKQQEIAAMLDLNQSKISTIKNQTLKMLQEVMAKEKHK